MRPEAPIHFQDHTNHKEFSDSLYKTLRNNVSFGDGINTDNMEGAWGTDGTGHDYVTMPAVANTAITITHNLNRVPKMYSIRYKDRACDVYDSGVAWNTTTISVKCSVANAKIRIYIY